MSCPSAPTTTTGTHTYTCHAFHEKNNFMENNTDAYYCHMMHLFFLFISILVIKKAVCSTKSDLVIH